MKSICISYIINLIITKYIEKVHRTHKKKVRQFISKETTGRWTKDQHKIII